MLEASLIFICILSLFFVWDFWYILPIMGLGAAECALGLSLLVRLARRSGLFYLLTL